MAVAVLCVTWFMVDPQASDAMAPMPGSGAASRAFLALARSLHGFFPETPEKSAL
jgi:hypothetical protein